MRWDELSNGLDHLARWLITPQLMRRAVRPREIVSQHLPMMLMLGALPLPCLAQAPIPQPAAAVYLGAGNHYGWLGGGGEAYLPGAPLSLSVGLGFAPQGPTVAGAAGVRYYLRLDATPHRLFGDLSVSLMHLSRTVPVGPAPLHRDYGLGVSVGYSYLAPSGFTVTAGGGVGAWEFGAAVELFPVVQLAVGRTWLR
jgi:hypothetical protein